MALPEVFPIPEGCTRVALGIAYAGDAFYGWQTQPCGRTVQDVLERALGRFVTQPVATICAGRTDTGVHGVGQVVHIDAPCERRMASWVRGVNAFLPETVAVRWAAPVDERFHARFSALSRTYRYWIVNDAIRSPLYVGRAGWVFRPCDAEAMHEAAQALVGEHDFTSFRAADCQAATPVRTVKAVSVVRRGALIGIEITANAFLQHMVRNIVGTLVYVGVGREKPEWVAEVLAARCRAVAAPTFDPSGLYLTAVEYPERYALASSGATPFDT